MSTPMPETIKLVCLPYAGAGASFYRPFDIKTGRCTGGPAIDDLRTYPLRVVDDEIQIEM